MRTPLLLCLLVLAFIAFLPTPSLATPGEAKLPIPQIPFVILMWILALAIVGAHYACIFNGGKLFRCLLPMLKPKNKKQPRNPKKLNRGQGPTYPDIDQVLMFEQEEHRSIGSGGGPRTEIGG